MGASAEPSGVGPPTLPALRLGLSRPCVLCEMGQDWPPWLLCVLGRMAAGAAPPLSLCSRVSVSVVAGVLVTDRPACLASCPQVCYVTVWPWAAVVCKPREAAGGHGWMQLV